MYKQEREARNEKMMCFLVGMEGSGWMDGLGNVLTDRWVCEVCVLFVLFFFFFFFACVCVYSCLDSEKVVFFFKSFSSVHCYIEVRYHVRTTGMI